MSRFKRLLEWPVRALSQNARIAGVAKLPTELLMLVLQYVWDMATLAALCRANKTFLAIAQPRLYHNIFLIQTARRVLREEAVIYLFRILRHTRLSELVTNLTIEINLDKSCTSGSRVKCQGCDKRDARLGKTLVILSSLQSFDLYCGLCPSAGGRHGYISRLNQQLTSFLFHCKCRRHSYADIVELVSTQAVNSVSALTLELEQGGTSGSQAQLSDALQMPNFLPNLKTMGQDGSTIPLLIMAHRPLERVGIAWYSNHTPDCFHQSLSGNPRSIRSLFSDLILDWSTYIRDSPEVYANIVELGTFTFSCQPVGDILCLLCLPYHRTQLEDIQVLTQLSFLSTLPNLQIIHINRMHRSSGDAKHVVIPVDTRLVHHLGEMCQSLQRIRVGNRPWKNSQGPPLLWERRDPASEWICYPLVSIIHTHWETIKGRTAY